MWISNEQNARTAVGDSSSIGWSDTSMNGQPGQIIDILENFAFENDHHPWSPMINDDDLSFILEHSSPSMVMGVHELSWVIAICKRWWQLTKGDRHQVQSPWPLMISHVHGHRNLREVTVGEHSDLMDMHDNRWQPMRTDDNTYSHFVHVTAHHGLWWMPIGDHLISLMMHSDHGLTPVTMCTHGLSLMNENCKYNFVQRTPS